MNKNSMRGRVRSSSTNNDTEIITPKAPECAANGFAAPGRQHSGRLRQNSGSQAQYTAARDRGHPFKAMKPGKWL
jgi:hypothetical protein